MRNNEKRWRLRFPVLVALVAALVSGGALVAPGAAHADTATLSRRPLAGSTYVLLFTITNDTSGPLNSWRMEFDLPPGEEVIGLFAFTIKVTKVGQHFILENKDPQYIGPGASVSYGIAVRGQSWPENCVTRGTPCIIDA